MQKHIGKSVASHEKTKFTLNLFMYMWHPLPIDLILHPSRYSHRRRLYYCSTAADNSIEAAAVANHWPKRTVYRCKNGSERTVVHTVPP